MKSLLCCLLLLCGFTAALAAPAELSEVQKLKAKNYVERRSSLPARFEYEKAQAFEAITKKYQQEAAGIEQERQALETEFRTALEPEAATTFDWPSLTFKAPKKDTK